MMTSDFTNICGYAPADLLPGVHAGHDQGSGLLGLIDQLLETVTRDTPSAWHLLGGIETLGANVHPLLVHFPIAFLTGFLVVEVLGLALRKPAARQWASGLLYLGAFSAVLTAIAGLIAAETVTHGALVHAIMQWHMRAGLTVATLATALGLWRRMSGLPASSMAQAFSLFLAVLMAVVMVLGADLGGMMVYQHGVGVHSLQQASEHQHHLHGETGRPPSRQNPEE